MERLGAGCNSSRPTGTFLLRESDRLHKLVEGLLNFGRMEAGQLKYRFEPVNPNELLQEVVADFEREVSRRGYHVELHSESSLPAIRADRESLVRVFWNLLDNAVKYSPDNRSVQVDLSNGGRRVAVRVTDHGIGIPADRLQMIFDPFQRAVSQRRYGGLGLGLYIVHTIVRALGGAVRVESAPGAGATFIVELPRNGHSAR